jgi:UDP-N-acetylmuramoyl-tripeptide--D-alanyl-D-alanine ligase
MPALDIGKIVETTGGRLEPGTPDSRGVLAKDYSIDTRSLKPGDLFLALSGEQRDGHEFVSDAHQRGACGAVVARVVEGLPSGFPQIVVPSPLAALQQLARQVRKELGAKVVAIAGSNGKTTTKEMLAEILASKFKVHRSPANYNNHIGVPLSILKAGPQSQVVVLELGSNHRGEIAALADIAKPDIALVTNIGRAHIGYFGSIRTIAMEKTDVLRGLATGGAGVINADDPAIQAAVKDIEARLVGFGLTEAAAYRATDVRQIDGSGYAFKADGVDFTLRLPGMHNVYNAVGALAAATLMGVAASEASRILERFQPVRMKTLALGQITLIDDCYNANPDSVRAVLDMITGIPARRKVFVMGEMLELGEYAPALHREIGSTVAVSDIDIFFGIGGLTRHAVDAAREAGMARDAALFLETKAEAKSAMRQVLEPGDLVLLKGSRRAGLEDISDFLRQDAVKGRA